MRLSDGGMPVYGKILEIVWSCPQILGMAE